MRTALPLLALLALSGCAAPVSEPVAVGARGGFGPEGPPAAFEQSDSVSFTMTGNEQRLPALVMTHTGPVRMRLEATQGVFSGLRLQAPGACNDMRLPDGQADPLLLGPAAIEEECGPIDAPHDYTITVDMRSGVADVTITVWGATLRLGS